MFSLSSFPAPSNKCCNFWPIICTCIGSSPEIFPIYHKVNFSKSAQHLQIFAKITAPSKTWTVRHQIFMGNPKNPKTDKQSKWYGEGFLKNTQTDKRKFHNPKHKVDKRLKHKIYMGQMGKSKDRQKRQRTSTVARVSYLQKTNFTTKNFCGLSRKIRIQTKKTKNIDSCKSVQPTKYKRQISQQKISVGWKIRIHFQLST